LSREFEASAAVDVAVAVAVVGVIGITVAIVALAFGGGALSSKILSRSTFAAKSSEETGALKEGCLSSRM